LLLPTKRDNDPRSAGNAGIIYNVALNQAGTALIAGISADAPYGAFVSADRDLIPLQGLPAGPGFLDGAALDNSVAIVADTSGNAPCNIGRARWNSDFFERPSFAGTG
jgi:hypothetical protein